jgi:hypothetical protein
MPTVRMTSVAVELDARPLSQFRPLCIDSIVDKHKQTNRSRADGACALGEGLFQPHHAEFIAARSELVRFAHQRLSTVFALCSIDRAHGHLYS